MSKGEKIQMAKDLMAEGYSMTEAAEIVMEQEEFEKEGYDDE